MHIQKRSRRVRAAIVGTLLASVISVGAVADTASAANAKVSVDQTAVNIKVDISTMSLRSGIRW